MQPTIYEVERIGSGFVAIMARPVADWLADEVSGLALKGVQRVISLLQPHEEYELGLQQEAKLCASHGIEFIAYAMPDRGLPLSVATFSELTQTTYHAVEAGKSTVIHCRAGIGRSGLVTAGVLLHCGFEPAEAFSHVSKARRVNVPDTPEQRAWLLEHAGVISSRTVPLN